LQQEKSGAIIIVEVIIIKNGINRQIPNMAGSGVITPNSPTIVRHTVSGTNTIVGIADRFTDIVTPDATTGVSNTQ
jgi:hypothetical protein